MRCCTTSTLCAAAAALILGAAPLGALSTPAVAEIAVAIGAPIAPPLLAVDVQPPIPGPGYIWAPGYWAWGGDDYSWVGGFWTLPPAVDLLWTPGYWDFDNGGFVFVAGYWGPTVGFYGGVDYGFGYPGEGYDGGYWRHHRFHYNRAVNNLGRIRLANTYDRRLAESRSRVSFDGGKGGTGAKPTAAQLAAARERHVAMTADQAAHEQAAKASREAHFKVNHGNPALTASTRERPTTTAAAASTVSRQVAAHAAVGRMRGARVRRFATVRRAPFRRMGVMRFRPHRMAVRHFGFGRFAGRSFGARGFARTGRFASAGGGGRWRR